VRHKGARYRRQFETELGAKQWEAESVARLLKGELPDMGEASKAAQAKVEGKPYTMGELLDRVERIRWAAQSAGKTQITNARTAVAFLGREKPITQVDNLMVGNMVAHFLEEGAEKSTINRKLSAFNVLMKEALDLEIIQKAPKRAMFKENEGRIRRFTHAEQAIALGYFALNQDQDMEDFIRLSLATGLREGEVLSLNDTNTADPAFVKVFGPDAKSKKNRAVPVTDEVVRDIITRRRERNPRGLLFPDLNKDRVTKQWNKLRGSMDLLEDKEFVPHILRHEFCSRLADLDISVQVIQALAGHEDITTTMRYIHPSPNTLKRAILQLSIHGQVDATSAIRAAEGVANSEPQLRHAA
jgi:integrase